MRFVLSKPYANDRLVILCYRANKHTRKMDKYDKTQLQQPTQQQQQRQRRPHDSVVGFFSSSSWAAAVVVVAVTTLRKL